MFSQMPQSHIDFMLSKIPMGRFGTVDELGGDRHLGGQRGVRLHHRFGVRRLRGPRDLLGGERRDPRAADRVPDGEPESNLDLVDFVRGCSGPRGSSRGGAGRHRAQGRAAGVGRAGGGRRGDAVGPFRRGAGGGAGLDGPAFAMTERDGRCYGRGAADMKGFVACALAADARAPGGGSARRCSWRFPMTRRSAASGCACCDADRGAAAAATWCWSASRPAWRSPTGTRARSRRARCARGRAGHSALAPLALNAIHLACDFVAAIRAGRRRWRATGPAMRGTRCPIRRCTSGSSRAAPRSTSCRTARDRVRDPQHRRRRSAGAARRGSSPRLRDRGGARAGRRRRGSRSR